MGAIVLSLEPLQPVILNDQIINIDVVDGQQRFTSLTIILSMLYSYAKLHKEEYMKQYASNITKSIEIEDFYSDYIEKINQSLLYRPESSHIKKPILQVSEVFRDLYEEIIDTYLRNISNQTIEDIYDNFEQKTKSAHESSFSRMVQIAGEAKDFILRELIDIDNLKKFVIYIMDKVQIVVTATQTLNSAFNVFESLNGRGMGLLPEDLIKNYLLKNIKENTNYIKNVNIWNEFIKNLKKDSSEKYQFLPSYFFDLYFLSNGKVVSKTKLFTVFTENKEINTDIEINKFLLKIKELSLFLAQQFINLDALNRISFGLGFSSVLALYEHRADSNYKQYIDQIVRLGFVLLIAKDKQIKEKVRDLNIKIISYKSDSDITLLATIKKYVDEIVLKDSIRTDFTNKLKILKVGRTGDGSSKAKYMLSIISEKLDGSSYDISSTMTQIEHFLPITRNYNCEEEYTEVEYSAYKHRIGNITIMRQIPNAWNSNHCFKEKIKRIKDSQSNEIITSSVFQEIQFEHCAPQYKICREKFNYIRKDINSELWEKEDIEKRTNSLVELAEYIWIDGNI